MGAAYHSSLSPGGSIGSQQFVQGAQFSHSSLPPYNEDASMQQQLYRNTEQPADHALSAQGQSVMGFASNNPPPFSQQSSGQQVYDNYNDFAFDNASTQQSRRFMTNPVQSGSGQETRPTSAIQSQGSSISDDRSACFGSLVHDSDQMIFGGSVSSSQNNQATHFNYDN